MSVSDLADKITPIDLGTRDKLVLNASNENSPILIVAQGEVRLACESGEVITLKKESVFGDLFQEGATPKVIEMEATERSIVFKINLVDFYFVLANHHELVQGLINNITGKPVAVNS